MLRFMESMEDRTLCSVAPAAAPSISLKMGILNVQVRRRRT
jgi:hypothetical protein